MSWADVYLICFIVGFTLSLLSFLLGALHIHLPRSGHSGLHSGSRVAPLQAHNASPRHANVQRAQPSPGRPSHISPYNFSTLSAFLAWFGGTGFLLTQYYRSWFLLVLGSATLAGWAGAAIVFWFLVKFLLAHDHTMDPADYELVGVLGTVSSAIRQGRTGEITYSQGGTRKTVGARSENGTAISKGAEVVVTRYDKGLAYVRRWKDVANTSGSGEPEGTAARDPEQNG